VKGGCALALTMHSLVPNILICFCLSQYACPQLRFLVVGTTWALENSLWHSLFSCTPSFNAHWSSSLSSSIFFFIFNKKIIMHTNKFLPILSVMIVTFLK
jgi:hypothetical protein